MFNQPFSLLFLSAERADRLLFTAFVRLLMLAVILMLLLGPRAYAGEVGIIDQLRPALGDLVAIALTALVAYAVQRFKAWTGIEIEARHREALQSALANAARKIIGGSSIHDGVVYVENSVPDALEHLGVKGTERIRDLLLPHISGLQSASSKG